MPVDQFLTIACWLLKIYTPYTLEYLETTFKEKLYFTSSRCLGLANTWSKMVILILRVILVMMGVSKNRFRMTMSCRNRLSAKSVLFKLYWNDSSHYIDLTHSHSFN